MSSAMDLTSANFEAEVEKAATPALVDFWAPWCGPCRMMAPVVDAIAEKYAGKVVVGKINVDEAGDLAMKFGVRSIPTIMIFKGGQAVDVVVGAVPEADLVAKLEKVLA
jgi:thioredoxin 1